jgi:hypothetical protein
MNRDCVATAVARTDARRIGCCLTEIFADFKHSYTAAFFSEPLSWCATNTAATCDDCNFAFHPAHEHLLVVKM